MAHSLFLQLLDVIGPNIGILTGAIHAFFVDPGKILQLLLRQRPYTRAIQGGIANIRDIMINDAHHVVLSRGKNRNSPVVVVLHGGPGATDIPFQSSYGSTLEQEFVVIHYDQRGSCKSGRLNKPSSTHETKLTIEQHILDAVKLIEWIVDSGEYPGAKDGVFLIGGSWGSVLALYVVQRRPDLIRKVLLRGLVTDQSQSERLAMKFIRERMKIFGFNRKLIDYVQTLGPPYGNDITKVLAQRDWLAAMGGMDFLSFQSTSPVSKIMLSHSMAKALFLCPEMSLRDIVSMKPCMITTLKHMWSHVERLDMIKEVPEIATPVAVVHGKRDVCTSYQLVEDFLKKLKAPQKNLVWFEKSGHSPQKEESAEFCKVVISFFLSDFVRYDGKYPPVTQFD